MRVLPTVSGVDQETLREARCWPKPKTRVVREHIPSEKA
jgi:hypothetical protein